MNRAKTILITGASSGIGAALALEYAAPGIVLHLGGRDRRRLDATASRCRSGGARVLPRTVDVTDCLAMRTWLEEADDTGPLDMVIANAGIGGAYSLAGNAGEDEEIVRRIFETNAMGVINTVAPIQPRMAARKRGHLVFVSSIAGWRGLPDAPAYSASKAAIKVYGEGLRPLLSPHGVKVSVVLPGYVASPMSDSLPFARPFLVSAERAARRIRRGLDRGRGRIAFPWPLVLGMWLLAALPVGMVDPLLARLRMTGGEDGIS